MKKLGFIGTGNMGSALILAAAKSNSENELLLSDKIREKADALAEKTGGKVVLLSAGNEVESAREAIKKLPENKVIDLAGKTKLGELMILLRHAEICLANDSGSMHLSALVGGAGICVFGSTDPAATSPISRKWRILYDKMPCSPCFKRVCPMGTKECLYRVTPSMVIPEMEKLLSR
jgi:heptosyltransferase-2